MNLLSKHRRHSCAHFDFRKPCFCSSLRQFHAHTRRADTRVAAHLRGRRDIQVRRTRGGTHTSHIPPAPARVASFFSLLVTPLDHDVSFPLQTARRATTTSPRATLIDPPRSPFFFTYTQTQGLPEYERLRAVRIAQNDEMMLRLGLPALGSALRDWRGGRRQRVQEHAPIQARQAPQP